MVPLRCAMLGLSLARTKAAPVAGPLGLGLFLVLVALLLLQAPN